MAWFIFLHLNRSLPLWTHDKTLIHIWISASPLVGELFSFTWTPRRRSVIFASLSMFLFSILVFNFIPYRFSGQFFLVLYYLMQDKVDWFRIAPNVFTSFLFWNLIHFFFIPILVFTSGNFNKLNFSFSGFISVRTVV